MERSDILDEIEPATSSTLSGEKRTVRGKHFKKIALLCSIHNVDFKNFAEEHELGLGENLSAKVNFALADPPYSAQRDLEDNHVEHDVLGSNVMKDMAKVLLYMKKPGAPEHVFCSALLFVF